MRLFCQIVLTVNLAGCALATTGEHDWLQESERTQWREVSISVFDRHLKFELPDKSMGAGMHTRVNSFVANQTLAAPFVVPDEWQSDAFRRVVTFLWDRSWGGYSEQSEWDFTLDVSVSKVESDVSLLDLSAEERVQNEWAIKREYYENAEGWPSKEWFFEHFWVRPFNNDQSKEWIVQNVPQVKASHEVYSLPITPSHELRISFFVAEDRNSGPASDQWKASRWSIARKIMDSVVVDPAPYP